MRPCALLVALVGCGRIAFDAANDGGLDVGADACTFSPFALAGRVPGPVTSAFDEWSGMAYLGDTQLMFHRYETNGDLFVASRASPADTFANVGLVAELNTVGNQWTPALSEDGLEIVYAENSTTMPEFRLYSATRSSAAAPFVAQGAIVSLASAGHEFSPWLSPDGLRLMFTSARSGTDAVYESTRSSRSAPFGTPTLVDLGVGNARDATLSSDGLELFFASSRAGGLGGFDVWTARRVSLTDPFDAPQHVPALSSTRDDAALRFTRDGRQLYINYDTLVSGGAAADIWLATRSCI